MSWEWSHSQEAYEDAYQNLHTLGVKILIVILAEWSAKETPEGEEDDSDSFNQKAYATAKRRLTSEYRAKRLDKEAIANAIWERASEQASCSNGGWEAYLCPYGCGCHCVPFDLTKEAKKRLENAG